MIAKILNCMIMIPCFAIEISEKRAGNRRLGLDSHGGEVIEKQTMK
jgi:hypothetical protein